MHLYNKVIEMISRIFFILSFKFAGVNNGELSQGFLNVQFNNPNINQREREILFTVLSHFNHAAVAGVSSTPENNMPHPVLPNNVSARNFLFVVGKF